MGFFDYFTGEHDPNDDKKKAGKLKPTPTPTPVAGNVEDSDDAMLKDLIKGKR